MFKKTLLIAALGFYTGSALAEEVPIIGNVQSKCVINIDTIGVYGNPTADKLSTTRADGGIEPIIRYDVSLADAYKAKVTHPNSFSTSPSLDDNVTWAGSTSVADTSDAGMSGYDAAKVEYDNVTEFDLTVAGSTWFKVSSTATYGYGKALPGGEYRSIVQAECIAK
jgi:hypothetical protein